jgi:hypothetical protein
LGKLACLITSKILGIGTVERKWKQIKAVKLGQRTNTGMDKTKKQVMIYSQYQQMKAQARIQKLSCAGKLWDDDDFKSMKMDEHCREIEDALEVYKGIWKGRIRVVKTWVEGWEKKVLGPSGDEIFEARLVHKYGGLKWFDPDENAKFIAHPNKMYFKKKRGNNQYMILGIKDGFDLDYEENHESNVDLWEPWHLSYDFFEQVTLYYKDSADVLCYSKEPDVCKSN